LAGTDTDGFLTAEPAVVVPTSWEEEQVEEMAKQERSIPELTNSVSVDTQNLFENQIPRELPQTTQATAETQSLLAYAEKRKVQHGVTIRRAAPNLLASRRRGSTFGTTLLESLNERKSLGNGLLEPSSDNARTDESLAAPFKPSYSVRNIEEKTTLDSKQTSFRQQALSKRGMSWSTRSSPSLNLVSSLRNSRDSSSMANLVADIAHTLLNENSVTSKDEDKEE
jgi:hypothetical protein